MGFFQNLKPISISLSPNTEKDDIQLSLKFLFHPSSWKRGPSTSKLEEEFKGYLGVKEAVSFNSGRSALIAILDAIGIKEREEILIQAFTCSSAINPILGRGAKPVFVDVDETINLDPKDLKEKITTRTKAIIIQHTFGFPVIKIEEILRIAKEHNLFLIEDCAHALGAKYLPPTKNLAGGKGKFCGTFGDVAFFSFGRDKVISSVFGGMAVTNNDEIGSRLRYYQEKLEEPSNFWIFQQLLHPVLMNYLILPAYGLNSYLGRVLLGVFHKLSILSKGVYKEEKRGEIPKYFPKKLPDALSSLALNQFKKLERFNEHRREIARFYEENLKEEFELPFFRKANGDVLPVYMSYPILLKDDTEKLLEIARKKKIYLDSGWRKTPIVPPDSRQEKMGYLSGSCKRAERIAKNILTLPTHINISQNDAKRIVELLKDYGN